jgi:transcriptional coactivator HFI1/ADA1
MAGTIQPNDTSMANNNTLPFSSIPDLDPPLTLKKPTAPRTPRIDVEPLYSAVKGAISDADWTTYKTSLTQFLLGNLNQEELSFKLSKILNTSALEHSHNTLVAAIYANIWRDAPEPGIASWVSSTDKPSSSTVKGQGDESEKRLKYEVMQLSRRERKRLKTIPAAEANLAQDGMGGGAGVGALGPVNELVEMRRVKQPEIGPVGPAGGYKTSQYLYQHSERCNANSTPNRLGPRNPQTLHLRPLLRNPRIPHRHLHLPTPPPHVLRIRAPPRPHPRMS